MGLPAPRIGRARICWPERALERAWATDLARSSPLDSALRARVGRSSPLARPKSPGGADRRRFWSFCVDFGPILVPKWCPKRLRRRALRGRISKLIFGGCSVDFARCSRESRFLANIAGALRFVGRHVHSQCSSRFLSTRASHDDRARIASRFG